MNEEGIGGGGGQGKHSFQVWNFCSALSGPTVLWQSTPVSLPALDTRTHAKPALPSYRPTFICLTPPSALRICRLGGRAFVLRLASWLSESACAAVCCDEHRDSALHCYALRWLASATMAIQDPPERRGWALAPTPFGDL